MRTIILLTLTSIALCLGACASGDEGATGSEAPEVNAAGGETIVAPRDGALVGRTFTVQLNDSVRFAQLKNLRTDEQILGHATAKAATFEVPESFEDGDDLEIITPQQKGVVVRLWTSGKPGIAGLDSTGLGVSGLEIVDGKLEVRGAALFYESIEGQGGSRVGMAALRIVDLSKDQERVVSCHLAGGCAGGGAELVGDNRGQLRSITTRFDWSDDDNHKEFAIGQLDAKGNPIHFGCFKVMARLEGAISVGCPENAGTKR